VTLDYRNPRDEQPTIEQRLRALTIFKRVAVFGWCAGFFGCGLFILAVMIWNPSPDNRLFRIVGPLIGVFFFLCWACAAAGFIGMTFWKCPRCGKGLRKGFTNWPFRRACAHCGLPFVGALGGKPLKATKL
jgi:hypothetical protein